MINPFRFKTPVSPHLASEAEGFAVDKEIILDRYRKLSEKYRYIVAEGCGGLAVPLSRAGYMQFQLIKEMGFLASWFPELSWNDKPHFAYSLLCPKCRYSNKGNNF